MEKCKNAISIYQEANHDIDTPAHEWDMDFVVLCDLVD